MSTYVIERDIEIAAPIEVVWRTITEPEQIRRWFSDAAEIEAHQGAAGTLTFEGDRTGEPLVVNITVVAADRPHRFSFRWIHPAGVTPTAENSVLVTFTLTERGAERTQLRVAETGIEGLDWPDEEKTRYVDQHRHGWQTYGDKLRDLFTAANEKSP